MKVLDRLAQSELTPFKAALGVLLYKPVVMLQPYRYRYQRKQSNLVYKSFFNSFFRPKRSAMMTLIVPSEIFAALGIPPMMIESLGGILGSLGMTSRFLHAVSRAGLPESLCTFHKMHLAFALEGGFRKPRFTVAASALCDGNLRALQLFTELTDSQFSFLDIPHPDQEGAVEYLARQIEETYFTMAREMKIKNPQKRIEKAVEASERARHLLVEINEIRKTHYLPGTNELIWLLAIISTYVGSDEALDTFRTLLRDLEKHGEPIPGDKKRLLLVHLLPLYNHPVFEKVFQRNVVITMEEFNHIDWPVLDPARPFESIAARVLSWPVMAPPRERVEKINRIIDEYSIDGVIFTSHWGCRQSDGPIHAVQSHVRKPFLRIETDLVDGNSASTGQLSTRLEGFLEMIGAD